MADQKYERWIAYDEVLRYGHARRGIGAVGVDQKSYHANTLAYAVPPRCNVDVVQEPENLDHCNRESGERAVVTMKSE